MGKKKNKKKNMRQKLGLSDRVADKKRIAPEKVNPFEIHINRQKHSILGKVRKFEKGLPGVSRIKATQKRKDTLLKEYQQRNKVNKLIDRRLGEYDSNMSTEDKMLARFAKEKQKSYEKVNIFNLNDEEEVAPYGQSLADIDKFTNRKIDSDDDDDEEGELGADFVSEGHFGGFLTKKVEGTNTDEKGQKQSHNEFIGELIAKSKQEKMERQLEKEQTMDLTDKLDLEWKQLKSHLGPVLTGKKVENVGSADDYDILVNQLMFEAKAKATDRLKTEEELALEAKVKLERMEADRLCRMQGLVSDSARKVAPHVSADDLDDGFILDDSDKRIPLSYNREGEMLLPDGMTKQIKGILKKSDDLEVVKKKDKSIDEYSDDDDDEMDDTESGKEDINNGDDNESSEDDEDSEDDNSDLKSENSDDEDRNLKVPPKKVKFQMIEKNEKKEEDKKLFIEELKRKKVIMESARKELPYTFKAPETYEEFKKMLFGSTIDDQVTIVDRTIKCNHPSLGEGNKQKLESLFAFILQYVSDVSDDDASKALDIMNRLTSNLYSLAQLSPFNAGDCLLDVIKEKQAELQKESVKRAGRASFPTLDVLIYLKLISVLFSTSDYRHKVVTPTMLYMSQLLTQCPIKSQRDVAAGLYICNLFYEFVSFSKRFVPEAINFLRGLLQHSLSYKDRKCLVTIPPFRTPGKKPGLLEVLDLNSISDIAIKKFSLSNLLDDNNENIIDDEFRVLSLHAALNLSQRFADLYECLPSYKDIFTPILQIIHLLPSDKYPTQIQLAKSKLVEQLSKSKFYTLLVQQKRKPQPLKMLEPKIEDNFDPTRKNYAKNSSNFNEKQKLTHKYKRELKGAVREIRKDSQFLARQQLKDKLLVDKERADKTKRIMSLLKEQEGDYNALKRKK